MFKNHDSSTSVQFGNGLSSVTNNNTSGSGALLNQNGATKNGDALSEANGGATMTGSQVPYATAGANGSIITMTLKNNHLIVETEERSVSAKVQVAFKRNCSEFTQYHLLILPLDLQKIILMHAPGTEC